MVKIGIIGATGYAGGELVRLLLGHKEAEIIWYGSKSYVDQNNYEARYAILACARHRYGDTKPDSYGYAAAQGFVDTVFDHIFY